ncbi:MAG: hypothetical protein CVU70_01680 [Deltaproteobacteria bacterium HGW-Deltaproteobacteria-5]|nr:MAG: hypothetical protein CVU70_01680 [Deltaproteobacteria bacterium HGW-Deltaproteobacteria-5]
MIFFKLVIINFQKECFRMKKMLVIVVAIIFSFTCLLVFKASAGRPIQKTTPNIKQKIKAPPKKTVPQKTLTDEQRAKNKKFQDNLKKIEEALKAKGKRK